MSRKRIPKGPVRRMVFLHRESLMWALQSMRDDRNRPRDQGDAEWDKRWDAADKHLRELIAASERA